jgi:uncharacterized protein (DUF433 family)
MAENQLLRRITCDPKIFSGKPVIRGMRISVEMVLNLLAQGSPISEIIEDYPVLERDDIQACLACAHAVIAHDSLDSVSLVAQ